MTATPAHLREPAVGEVWWTRMPNEHEFCAVTILKAEPHMKRYQTQRTAPRGVHPHTPLFTKREDLIKPVSQE